MKKYLAVLFVCVSFFLSSCATTGIAVPGENGKRASNITAEYFNIAKSYEELKNYSKAIEYYNLAMQNPELENSCLFKIGRCYALNKDWINASSVYEKLLALDPENLSLNESLAYIKAMSGDLTGSEDLYAHLLETNKDNASLYRNYISVLIADNKMDDADSILSEMKEKFPDDSGISALEKKIDDYRKSLEQEKNDADTSENEKPASNQ